MASPALSRRALVGSALALGALPTRLFAETGARLLAGTYTQEGGPGLVPLTAGARGWTAGPADAAIRNASFGVRSTVTGLRYLLDEQQQGGLGIYDAGHKRIGGGSTLGADPCHAALSPDGATLAVANYSSGSVALWRLDRRTGLPTGAPHSIAHEGSGPNRGRQAAPHAHWVGFAGNGLLHAVDLGADAIFAHRLEARGVGTTTIAYRAEPGSGPRHLARHPRMPIAYLVAELANTVTILQARPDGSFAARGVVSTLPAGFNGASAAAHIALNRAGTRLYVSNRGHDSIAVFAIASDGGLTPIQHAGCGGHWPRLFLLLEARGELLVANQRSGNVARLPMERAGRLGTASHGPTVPGVAFLAS
ncbi:MULTISPECIES: lactonase family protein [unclassified Sphingomonas]|uniref:lactonase family protein n=1 Tax=unclassified Sphingomonas TaxID=196159 RepID=UPI00031D308C|nr:MULTISPECIES: beta-propeller fold lactonase family protein [unclassified Sphingomonas]KTF68776.1 6-phosphogluconolactonase [Sphingomonas sp. WG]